MLYWKTQAIVREGLKNVTAGANPIGIRRGIELATKAAVEELHKISTVVDSKEAIAQVGAVSSSSEEVGQYIADAMEKVGNDGVITIEESKGIETELLTKRFPIFKISCLYWNKSCNNQNHC